MSLVPKDYLTDVSIRDTKLAVKACCSICMEEFDSNIHLPKVLKCGHTFCRSCLDKAISSVQVSHYGGGDVNTLFFCPLCRRSEEIPNTGASDFPNNHQLLDVVASNDSRFLTCNVCKMTGSESTFHICRECTLSEKDYDIQKIIGNEEPPLHPDNYATCSTCVLKLHNTPGHTVVEYALIRIHYDFTKNLNSVAFLKARMVKESADARQVLGTILDRVAQNGKEVEEMVALMKKAKSSQGLSLIFNKYQKEMTSNITIMEVISKEGKRLNDMVTTKSNLLERGNAEISGVHCFAEPPDIKEILKISDTVQNQPSPDENMDILDSEEAEEADTQPQTTEASAEEPALRRSISQQTLPDHQQESHVIDLVSNEESIWNILGSTWETICYNINRIHQVLNHGANIRNRNNYNQEVNEISPYMLAVPVFALLAILIYMIVF
ncbi:hypothetical protein L3Y34_015250 [Caenorhabditis briggsae]|uniref:RING-type domain-containing protein n=1 Tax=Caenorhabditis briggsae TaxID=6238 RepID=A0AAE9DT43_CAEBR|nr:hypothetical protein L3Y34_015250 [Caenorhabditis briggsae]